MNLAGLYLQQKFLYNHVCLSTDWMEAQKRELTAVMRFGNPGCPQQIIHLLIRAIVNDG